MFLHLGGDISVLHTDVIGIFDIGITGKSTVTKEFLDLAAQDKLIFYVSADKVKSFVVTEKKVYYSPISSTTLLKRSQGEWTAYEEE